MYEEDYPRTQRPPLKDKAKKFMGYGYSEAFIEATMWASRSSETGMKHIKQAIIEARAEHSEESAKRGS